MLVSFPHLCDISDNRPCCLSLGFSRCQEWQRSIFGSLAKDWNSSHSCILCLPACFSIAGVPEAETASSSSETCDFLKDDRGDEVMTPRRPRTTEDLFAAIHRYPKLLPLCWIYFMSPLFPNRFSVCFSLLMFLLSPNWTSLTCLLIFLVCFYIFISLNSSLLCSTDFYDDVGDRGSVWWCLVGLPLASEKCSVTIFDWMFTRVGLK